MERHIGIWNEEKEDEKYEAGELIIDGNRIEFYKIGRASCRERV